MMRMGAGVRIVVCQGICERVAVVSGTLCAAMNVKTKNRCGTRTASGRKPKKLRTDYCTVDGLKKSDFTVNIRISRTSSDDGIRRRCLGYKRSKIG